NNSIAITVQAMGVLVQPANTDTKPVAANRIMGSGINGAKALPSVAPTKNSGVTSPPLNPALSVKVVRMIFIRKSYDGNGVSNALRIVGMPRPIWRVL